MKELLNVWSRYCLNRNLGLVLIRVAVGMVFFAHGWGKVNNLPMVEGMFTGFGLGAGTGVFIAYLEVIGGLAMILGIFTRVFGVILGIEMLAAVFLTGFSKGLYKPHELELVLMLLSFGIALTGSGKHSIYAAECDDCGGIVCDIHKK